MEAPELIGQLFIAVIVLMLLFRVLESLMGAALKRSQEFPAERGQDHPRERGLPGFPYEHELYAEPRVESQQPSLTVERETQAGRETASRPFQAEPAGLGREVGSVPARQPTRRGVKRAAALRNGIAWMVILGPPRARRSWSPFGWRRQGM